MMTNFGFGPMLQKFDRVSPKSTQSMSWLTKSHSWTNLGMGALIHYVIILSIVSGLHNVTIMSYQFPPKNMFMKQDLSMTKNNQKQPIYFLTTSHLTKYTISLVT